MANPLLGQILASVFSSAMRGRGRSGPFGRGAGVPGGPGGLGGIGGSGGLGGLRSGGGGALLAMLLPLAMQWVQRNGGLGAVLDRFRQKGYGPQANSWVATGPNQQLDPHAVDEVVGSDELMRLSQQLGVPQQEVVNGFAEILPEMVDQLSPEGEIPPEADDALNDGLTELERELSQLTTGSLR